MSKLVKLSVLGATSAVLCLAAPVGGSEALAGPVGLADASAVALPAATESVHYRRWHREGRSAYYCPPRRIYTGRSVARHCCISEGRTVYVRRYIIERRTAYVAPRYVPVVAATYPAYTYGYPYGGPGVIGAGAGLLGGILNVGFGGWGGGWGPGWGWGGRHWW